MLQLSSIQTPFPIVVTSTRDLWVLQCVTARRLLPVGISSLLAGRPSGRPETSVAACIVDPASREIEGGGRSWATIGGACLLMPMRLASKMFQDSEDPRQQQQTRNHLQLCRHLHLQPAMAVVVSKPIRL